MQSLKQSVHPHNACDVGLLPAKRLAEFRAFLDSHNVEIRDGNGGQYFHVRTTAGWSPIQRGKRDQVATPVSLRAVVDDFLKAPIGKAILSSHARSLFQSLPEFPAGTTEVQKITALVGVAQGRSEGEVAKLVDGAGLTSLQARAREHLGIDPAKGASHSVETTYRTSVDGQFEVLAVRDATASKNCHLVPCDSTLIDMSAPSAAPAPTQQQREYLRDLRDDFALRATVGLCKAVRETEEAFADRCWSFADLMMARRPTMAGD